VTKPFDADQLTAHFLFRGVDPKSEFPSSAITIDIQLDQPSIGAWPSSKSGAWSGLGFQSGHQVSRATLLAREDRLDDQAAETVPGNRLPVEGGKAILDGTCCRSHTVILSRARRARLRSTPQRYPEMSPLLRTTRWQGMATASAFAPQACATARAELGEPIRFATSE
jgi:hypothetical protein